MNTASETRLTALAQNLISENATVHKGDFQTPGASAFGNPVWKTGWHINIDGENTALGPNVKSAEARLREMAQIDYFGLLC